MYQNIASANVILRNAAKLTLTADASISSMNIGSGTTLDTNTKTLTLSGNWSNSGTAAIGSGTVVFAGANGSTSNISGTTTFNNFTCATPDKVINFASGSTQTITGVFTITGTEGHRITLARLDGTGSNQWNIKVTGSTSVNYASVYNSNASQGITIVALNSFNGGNNVNWVFGKDFSGRVYSDFGVLPIGANITVAISVNGGAAVKADDTDANGDYLLTSVEVAPGDRILVYLDGESVKGATVTVIYNQDLGGLDIYAGYLIIRHDYSTGYTTDAQVAAAHNGDSDIPYAIENSNKIHALDNLNIWSGDTFTMGGNYSLEVANNFINSGTINASSGNIDIAAASIDSGVITNSFGNITLASTSRDILLSDVSAPGYKVTIDAKNSILDKDSGSAPTDYDINAKNITMLVGTGTIGQSTAGNEIDILYTGTLIENVSPLISFASRTPANSYGWNNNSVTVTFIASDPNWYTGAGINNSISSLSITVTGEGENQLVTGVAFDMTGNKVTLDESNIDIDKTVPSISGTRDTLANSYGWNNANVLSSYSASDALSGLVESASGTYTFVSEGGNQSHTFTVTDKAGNSKSATVSSINIDLTAPLLSSTRTAANSYGWNNGPVNVSYNYSDALSDIDTVNAGNDITTDSFSLDGANQSASGKIYDKAGNSTSITVTGIHIDTVAPSISASRTAANVYGWNNASVSVNYTYSDSLSGIDSVNLGNDVKLDILSLEGAKQSTGGKVYDKAGNSTSITVTDINIDLTAPTISSSRTTLANTYGWNNTDVLTGYSASDALSGLVNNATGAYTFTVEAAKQSHIYSVTDKAGNSSSSTINDINIDKTAPTISATRSPLGGSTGWNNTDVTASYTASDQLSTLVSPATGSFTLSSDGANQSVIFIVRDQAGNSASATIEGVNIDKNPAKLDPVTNPIITPDQPPAPEPTQPTGEVIALGDGENLVSAETPTEASSTTPSYEEGDDILKKKYTAGKYRTVVIVYEGKVVVNPYDEEGIKENEGVALTAGQKATHEEEVN